MQITRARLLLPALCLLAAAAAAAQQPFEAVIAGRRVDGCRILPLVRQGVEWVNPDRVEADSDISALASGDGRRVFATVEGTPYRVVRIEPDGTRTPFFTGPSGFALAVTVADDGRVYVLVGGLITGLLRIDRISPAGVLEASVVAGGGTDGFDVASDNCTIYYGRGTTIRRFDACTGTELPDFATTPQDVTDLEVQPDGRVLVAVEGSVLLYSAAGALVRTVTTVAAHGLDPSRFTAEEAALRDGTLWVAITNACDTSEGGHLLRLSFDTGAVISRDVLSYLNGANSMVIGAAAASIPTLAEMALALLALALAAGGALVLRLR